MKAFGAKNIFLNNSYPNFTSLMQPSMTFVGQTGVFIYIGM
jgi:hypothetical protein